MAPVRRISRAGAVLLLVATSLAGAACDEGDEVADRTIELAHDTIRLADGVELYDVVVQRSGSGDFEPAVIRARAGDVVRFTAADNGGHAIIFDDALEAGVRDYLERTGQMRSPPLIVTDAAWVITLAEAPAGEYRFRCATHNATGRITVLPR
jgi:plastocyanin